MSVRELHVLAGSLWRSWFFLLFSPPLDLVAMMKLENYISGVMLSVLVLFGRLCVWAGLYQYCCFLLLCYVHRFKEKKERMVGLESG